MYSRAKSTNAITPKTPVQLNARREGFSHIFHQQYIWMGRATGRHHSEAQIVKYPFWIPANSNGFHKGWLEKFIREKLKTQPNTLENLLAHHDISTSLYHSTMPDTPLSTSSTVALWTKTGQKHAEIASSPRNQCFPTHYSRHHQLNQPSRECVRTTARHRSVPGFSNSALTRWDQEPFWHAHLGCPSMEGYQFGACAVQYRGIAISGEQAPQTRSQKYHFQPECLVAKAWPRSRTIRRSG